MEQFDNRETNSVGSSRIRANWVAKYWDEAELYHIGKDYDAIIYQKVFWGDMMKNFTGKQILDLCDPVWLEGRDVIKYVQLVDAVTTSTQALADYLMNFTDKPVMTIPDRIDLEEHKEKKTLHHGRLSSVAWFGYSHNTHYLNGVLSHLIKNNIRLRVISNEPYQPPSMYRKLGVDWVKWDYKTLHNDIIKADAVIFPPVDTQDLKGRYKSNNKDLTSMALGMPVIKTPEDLERFSDPKEREKASKEGIQEIKDNWDVRISVEEYKTLLNDL